MITVFHNKDYNDFEPNKDDFIPRSSLTKVAEVDTDDPETAYERTNCYKGNWTVNEGVTPLVSHPRSTSVGDVLEIKKDTFIVVSGYGFKDIEIDEEG